MIADYLAAEGAIIAHLGNTVPELLAVLGAAELSGIQEIAQKTPAAHIIYDGDVLPGGSGSSANSSSAQLVAQRWLVVVAVKNARGANTGAGARSDAGPLISKTIQALNGFQPTTSHRPMRRVQAPRPGYNKGYAYFPLMFETQLLTGASV